MKITDEQVNKYKAARMAVTFYAAQNAGYKTAEEYLAALSVLQASSQAKKAWKDHLTHEMFHESDLEMLWANSVGYMAGTCTSGIEETVTFRLYKIRHLTRKPIMSLDGRQSRYTQTCQHTNYLSQFKG